MTSAATALRDYEIIGVPSSGRHQPVVSEVREVIETLETLLTSITSTGLIIRPTLAALQEILSPSDNAPAIVYADATVANNRLYRKAGASGSGAWVPALDFIPGAQVVAATDSGAGTASAIEATTALSVPGAFGRCLIVMNIFEQAVGSPVTVRFNSTGTAYRMRDNNGIDIDPTRLRAGAVVLGIISGTNFFVLSSSATGGLLPTSNIWLRPGDSPALFGATKHGDATLTAPTPLPSVQNANGMVVRATGEAIVAPKAMFAVEPGRVYAVRWVVRRQTDPFLLAGSQVVLGLAWMGADKAALSSPSETVVQSLAGLSVAVGRYSQTAILSTAAGTGVTVIAPAGAIYARPFVQTLSEGGVTDIEVVGVEDITDTSQATVGDASVTAAQAAATSATASASAAATSASNAAASAASTAVATTNLLLRDTSNMFPDPNMVDANFYGGSAAMTAAGATFVGTSVAAAGSNRISIASNAAQIDLASSWFMVEPSTDYNFEIWAARTDTGAGVSTYSCFVELASMNDAGVPTLVTTITVVNAQSATGTNEANRASASFATGTAIRRARVVMRRHAGVGDPVTFGRPEFRRAAAADLYDPQRTTSVRRPIGTRLRDQVNVKDHGALGNNSADDAPNINNAMADAAALGGGDVYVPPGTYQLGSQLIIPANVTLRCDFGAATLVARSSAFNNADFRGAARYNTNAVPINMSGGAVSPFTPKERPGLVNFRITHQSASGYALTPIACRNVIRPTIVGNELYGFAVGCGMRLSGVIEPNVQQNYIHDFIESDPLSAWVEKFSGNGSQTDFILSNPNDYAIALVRIGGAATGAWTYNSGTKVLTFSSAPASGTNNIFVFYSGMQITGIDVDNDVINGITSRGGHIANNVIKAMKFTGDALVNFSFESDGITLLGTAREINCSNNVVSDVGEGIDCFGDQNTFNGLVATDCRIFGLKFTHGARGNTGAGITIRNAGLAGITITASSLTGDVEANVLSAVTVEGIDPNGDWAPNTSSCIALASSTFKSRGNHIIGAHLDAGANGKRGVNDTTPENENFVDATTIKGTNVGYLPNLDQGSWSPAAAVRAWHLDGAERMRLTNVGLGVGTSLSVGVAVTDIGTDRFRAGGLSSRYFGVDVDGRVASRFDNNGMTTMQTLSNLGITAANQGIAQRFLLNSGGAAGIEAAYIRAVAEGTFAAGVDAQRNASIAFGTLLNGVLSEVLRIKNTRAVRFVPLSAAPATGELGDMYVGTDAKLYLCTVAGTPGTWTVVGTQT